MGKSRVRRELRTLSNQIVPEGKRIKASLCSSKFLLSALQTLGLVLFYYIFSISLTFYNQHFIHRYPFPLTITLIHLVTKFAMSSIVRFIMSCRAGADRVTLSWGMYIKRVSLPGIFSSLDIALSNWSFEFITVSLYTMSKTTVIVFILGFSLLFKLEEPKCSLIAVVIFIFLGLFLFTYESTQFNLTGFILIMTASFLSGLRWTLSQIVTQKSEIGLSNPLDMMYHVQPWMILALLPLQMYIEGIRLAGTKYAFRFKQYSVLGDSVLLVLSGAGLAFMLEFSEYLLLSRTSSLTLSISGIFKEICIILMALNINHDVITPVNGIGLFLCLVGIVVHVIIKAQAGDLKTKEKEEDRKTLLQNAEESEEEVELFSVPNSHDVRPR